ncbi:MULTISPECIES: M15 family metallopeptidase [Salimicrobium]|uniref:Peptidase n=1 Tax=Salimicrobium humidisoli TaxID=2029857 RepID=A0ABX4HRG6_9BACI|nr:MULTISPECIES: M15 family metallopeptidase [Salimicrobium]PBB05653.1 peptidase [Salimicrobium humidisoli]
MIVSKNELVRRSVKNMGNVDHRIAVFGKEIIAAAYDEGIFAQITEGHRSYRRQAELYGQGRPWYRWNGRNYGSRGSIVTHAKPGQSVHNYGLAFDFCLVDKSGQQAIWRVNESWRRVASISKDLGFTWGGNWKNFKDYPHLEWTHGMTWKDLSSGRGPFDYPGFLIRRGSRGRRVKQVQRELDTVADGIFGPLTEKAAVTFQQKNNIQVDGIIGPQTWNKFYN